jgi:inorganic pyrophosphatase
MATAMFYPCNYGYIPNTLGDDGDPLDVLVHTPHRVISGTVIRCRPVGILKMDDEAGGDAKLVAVPVSKLTPIYDDVKEVSDLPKLLVQQIVHFFEHYKDLEKGKWVKVEGWGSADEAREEILKAIANFKHEEEEGGGLSRALHFASPASSGDAKRWSMSSAGSCCRRRPTARAGTPATVACAGTSASTRLPAPILAPSPMLTGPSTRAPAASSTPEPTFG